MDETEIFEEGQAFETPPPGEAGAFIVDLEGFEGPIDVLLSLAREQKLDLAQISILALADQYLAFVAEARRHNLELAADYLVMAAWLAYLKSRLLLPDLGDGEEPSGAEMAIALAFQLKRLEAMQQAGQELMARSRLGAEFRARGEPESYRRITNTVYDLSLFELLKAYGDQQRRGGHSGPLLIEPFELHTVDDALVRLRRLLGATPDWQSLWQFLPKDLRKGLVMRSAVASTFSAGLELAKEGKARIQQATVFGPIFMRSTDEGSDRVAVNDDAPDTIQETTEE